MSDETEKELAVWERIRFGHPRNPQSHQMDAYEKKHLLNGTGQVARDLEKMGGFKQVGNDWVVDEAIWKAFKQQNGDKIYETPDR